MPRTADVPPDFESLDLTLDELKNFDSSQVEIPPMREAVAIKLEGDQKGQRLVLYELQPKQFEALSKTPLYRRQGEDGPIHIGFGGAAGSGKSMLSRALAVKACIDWPGCNVLIIRRTKGEVYTNHVKPFRREVPETLPDGRSLYDWTGNPLAGCATFSNESDLYFGFMKEEGDETKYQGLDFDFIVFEEATHYSWDQVRYLTGERMRATTNRSTPFAFYPSNPGNKGMEWYKRLFIEGNYDQELSEDPSDYAFVQAYVWDNKVLLKRDPNYIRNLATLPEPLRSWRLWGDWSAGLGLAVPQINRRKHLVEPFNVPDHWPTFGAFDWGYNHPFSFGVYTVSEDERLYKIDTITGRRKLPTEIARYVRGALTKWGLSPEDLAPIWAGHDCWSQFKARGESAPTIAETFHEQGFRLVRARNYKDRVIGLNNLRKYLSWEGVGPDGENVTPYLLFFETDGNRECVRQIGNMPTDPDNPEDALKQDADETGRGGDDMYDETRYAAASRPPPAKSTWEEASVDPWSEEAIKAEADRKKRGNLPPQFQKDDLPTHPEFGQVY